MQEQEIQELIGALFASALGCGFVIALLVFTVFIWWRIFAKAGYPGALALLMLVPLVNLGLLCVLAFAEWPIQRELAQLRRTAGSPPTPQL